MGPVKSDNGQGCAYKLPQSLVAALRWHKTRQDTERKAMGDAWAPIASDAVDYVFIAVRSGGALNPGMLYKAFKRGQSDRARGLPPPRFATLRRIVPACAARPKKTISAFMGHASTRITDDIYTHLFQEELNAAADQIEQGLEGAFERRRKTGESGV